jgi:thiamine kinase
MATDISTAELTLARDLCQRFRAWAPGESAAPQPRHVLGGGHSNRSVLLEGKRARYVLRIGATPAPPGVDRQREAELAAAAAGRGVAPAVLYSDSARAVMITAWAGVAVERMPQLRELSALLQAIHRIPLAGPQLDSGVQLDRYRELLPVTGPGAELLRIHTAPLQAARECLAAGSRPAVTCHNDLLRANLLHDGSRLRAIDWEYAAAGDALFDLAACASELEQTQAVPLLEHYLGRPAKTQELREFHAQQLHYAAIACCWYEVHGGPAGVTRQSRDRFAALALASPGEGLL